MKYRITLAILGLLSAMLLAPSAAYSQGMQQCPEEMSHYWKLDEASGTTFADSLGTLNAVCTSSPTCPTAAGGRVGGAQHFGSGVKVEVSDDGSFDWGSTSSFAVELWLQRIGTTIQVAASRIDGTSDWWLGVWSDGKLWFQLKNGATTLDVKGGTVLAEGTWYHVAAIRDAAKDSAFIFLNGVREAAGKQPGVLSFSFATNLTIGWFNTGTFFYWNGLLDEVALYDRALTSAEVADHYNRGLVGTGYCLTNDAPHITSIPVTSAIVGEPYAYDVNASGLPAPTYSLSIAPTGMTIDHLTGLINWMPTVLGGVPVTVVATNETGQDQQDFVINIGTALDCPSGMSHYWNLDETSGQPFRDRMGGIATCTTCPVPVSGRVNGAQGFDSDDSVNVIDDGTFDWGPTSSFSIEFWMKKSSACSGSATNNNEVIVARFDTNARSWWLGVNCDNTWSTAGVIRFRLGDAGGPTDLYSTTSVTDGDWHHVVAVRNGGANNTKIYVDGALENTVSRVYTDGFASAAPLTLGHFNVSPYYHYNGILDEFALYDRALTAGEVLDHFSRGVVGAGYCHLCGDADASGAWDISDAVYLISFIFSGGAAPAPLQAGDANCDSSVDISDAVYLIAFIFGGGPAPCAICY
jgi:hypothetical protein